jgi:hypothetical protein
LRTIEHFGLRILTDTGENNKYPYGMTWPGDALLGLRGPTIQRQGSN